MSKTTTKTAPTIRLPQYRCLKALCAAGRPTFTRTELAAKAGFRPGSGTINRALRGIGKGSSSGDPYKGLVQLGYVEVVPVELDGGMTETRYRATKEGAKAVRAFAKDNGTRLGKVRSAEVSTNARYQIN